MGSKGPINFRGDEMRIRKNFILKELIPFILREEGRGFGMGYWMEKGPIGARLSVDGIPRGIPRCGTVACIGGSVNVLAGGYEEDAAATALGLSSRRAHTLFYGWERNWPKRFSQGYRNAHTTLGKANVVVRLLREVVRTNGKVLDTKSK
jgi:hypothetical protein